MSLVLFVTIVGILPSVEGFALPRPNSAFALWTAGRSTSRTDGNEGKLRLSATIDRNNNDSDAPPQTDSSDSSSSRRFLKKTRPVTFYVEYDEDDEDGDLDPISLLERNQQELSLSLGKLKLSLKEEQQKSQSLQERLQEAERVIAQQDQLLRASTMAEDLQNGQRDQEEEARLLEQIQQEARRKQQELLEEVQKLQVKLGASLQDLVSSKQEVDQVSRELQMAQSEINSLANRLETATVREKSYQTKAQKLQEKLDVARGKLGVKQEILTRTQRELAQARSKLDLQEKLSSKSNSNGAVSKNSNIGAVSPPSIFSGGFNIGNSGGTSSPAPSKSTPPSPKKSSPPTPAPSPFKASGYPIIYNWSLNTNTGEVTGIVRNHPEISDGTRIVTSALANPRLAATNAVVVTKSGSKYQLETPLKGASNGYKAPSQSPPSKAPSIGIPENASFNFFSGISGNNSENKRSISTSVKQPTRAQQMQEKFELELPLTGESIGSGSGSGTRYFLAGKSKRKPSGRSEIVMAYKANANLEPAGDPVALKLSTHKDKLDREYSNYQKIQKIGMLGLGDNGGQAFVRCYDFLPVLEGSFKYAQHSALVLERGGSYDLREYRSKCGSMDGETMKRALLTAARCVESLHKSRLIYTDLKAENLISMENSNSGNEEQILFKGVDLESAIPVKGNPVDYTPEASPPEFAVKYLQGEAYDFVLDYSYDIWSFGMLAYELGSGRGFFDKKQPAHIMKLLANDFQPPRVAEVIEDEKLCDLIIKCLTIDPRKRPTASQLVNHPYFRGEAGMPKLFGW